MRNYFQNLIKEIITKEDLILFFEEIKIVENFIFKEFKIPLSEKVKGKVREEFRKELKKLEDEGAISKSPDQQFSFFEELKKELQKIPQVKLEIAFEPSQNFLLKIKGWFKERNNQEIILDITKNPEIVAGAIIEYQGKYIDLSLVKKLNELFPTTLY